MSADCSRYQLPSSSSIAGRPLWPVPSITAVRPFRLGHDSFTTSYSTPVLVERLLDRPARMAAELGPHVPAAMQLQGHRYSSSARRRPQPYDTPMRAVVLDAVERARARRRPGACAAGRARDRARLRAVRVRRGEDRARGAGDGARARGRRPDGGRTPRRADPPRGLRRVRALPERARVDVRAVSRADDRAGRVRRARAGDRAGSSCRIRSTTRAAPTSSRSRACCAERSGCRAGACSSSATASSGGCSGRCSSGAATRCSRSTGCRSGRARRRTGRSTRPSSALPAAARRRSRRSSPAGRCCSSPTRARCLRTRMYRRELTVVGSRSATPAHMEEAVALLPELDVPEPTVVPLERFEEGLRAVSGGGGVEGGARAVTATRG